MAIAFADLERRAAGNACFVAHVLDIATSAKCAAGAGEDDGLNAVVARDARAGVNDLIPLRLVGESVAFFRRVESQREDGAGLFGEDEGHGIPWARSERMVQKGWFEGGEGGTVSEELAEDFVNGIAAAAAAIRLRGDGFLSDGVPQRLRICRRETLAEQQ